MDKKVDICWRCAKFNPAEVHTCTPKDLNEITFESMARQAGLTNMLSMGYIPNLEELKHLAAISAAVERAKIFKKLWEMHEAARGNHNYYHCAIVDIRRELDEMG